jgi:putative membrane protein
MNNILGKLSTVLDEGHMDSDHMMDGWFTGFNMWIWWIVLWFVLVVIAYLVYKDATERKMNGLLWFVLVIIPWIGFLFLIIYLIVRTDDIKPEYTQKSAKIILDERYARGEISQNEYLSMKKDMNFGE